MYINQIMLRGNAPQHIKKIIYPHWAKPNADKAELRKKIYDMIKERTNALAQELKQSAEYKEYERCREAALADESTRALLAEYNKLKRAAQAAVALGREMDELSAHKLNRLTEWLQMDEAASKLLLAEYNLNRLLGDVYRVLAEAVGIKMDYLEE